MDAQAWKCIHGHSAARIENYTVVLAKINCLQRNGIKSSFLQFVHLKIGVKDKNRDGRDPKW